MKKRILVIFSLILSFCGVILGASFSICFLVLLPMKAEHKLQMHLLLAVLAAVQYIPFKLGRYLWKKADVDFSPPD